MLKTVLSVAITSFSSEIRAKLLQMMENVYVNIVFILSLVGCPWQCLQLHHYLQTHGWNKLQESRFIIMFCFIYYPTEGISITERIFSGWHCTQTATLSQLTFTHNLKTIYYSLHFLLWPAA